MSFFNDPIEPINASEDHPIKVSPVEANKNRKSYQDDDQNENQSPLATFFLIYLKNFLHELSLEEKHLFSSFEEGSLAYHLHTLASLFDELKAVDLNQEISFYHSLSDVWQKTLLATKREKHLGVKTNIDITKLESLIQEIEAFPPDENKTLGYYLQEPPKGNWHPMPVREIINKLHCDHLEKNAGSILTMWTQHLKEIIYAKE